MLKILIMIVSKYVSQKVSGWGGEKTYVVYIPTPGIQIVRSRIVKETEEGSISTNVDTETSLDVHTSGEGVNSIVGG